MEQRGGCCIARYAAAGGYDMAKINRAMMRFRPIAPKPGPVTSASLSGGSVTPENSDPSVKMPASGGRGKKRNGGKDNGAVHKPHGGGGRKRKSPSKESGDTAVTVKTLPLLPEAPGLDETPKKESKQNYPMWLSFGGAGGHMEGRVQQPAPVVGSWVKVERVIDTWVVDGWYGGLGRTDEEKVMGLDLDTCPGFVTDGFDRVKWMNAAYKKMVAGEASAAAEVVAWVVVEGGVALPVGCRAFTCRVRVVTCGKEKQGAKTVPCDVWRMENGGFAWRLDTTAALSLGR